MRPQLRLRTLFVLVALCALAAAGWRHYARVYRPLSLNRIALQQAIELEAMWQTVSFDIPDWARVEMQQRQGFHRRKVGEYEQALWRPWLGVRDEPPPDFSPPRATAY